MIRKRVHIHIPYPLLIERFDEIRERGLNPEIYFSGEDMDTLSLGDVRSVKRGLDERGATITFHAPFMDLAPGGGDERVRQVTIDRYQQLFHLADILQPMVIVVHSGYDRWRYDNNEQFWLQQSLKTWPPFVERAERIGAVIAMENVFEDKPDTLRMIVEHINAPNFRLCFDPGHWNLFSKIPLAGWFDEIGEYISEIHVHDNRGDRDDHLAIGDGEIDFATVFQAARSCQQEILLAIEAHDEEVLWRALKNLEGYGI